MTSPDSNPPHSDEPTNPYTDAVAAQLQHAPAQLAPQVAAEIGDLIGPIDAHAQDAAAARPVA